jgi:uncharacterized caspase-like protein
MKFICCLVLLFSLLDFTEAYSKTYAVIIGVSIYDNPLSNLNYADKDAREFSSFLQKNADSLNITLLTNADATKDAVLKTIKEKFLLAKENDIVIFFFSGHGAQGKFLCYDSRLGENYLMHEEVKAAFKSSRAKTKICFADACFSGSIKTSKENYKKNIGGTKELKSIIDFELIVFMSSQPWQISREKPALGQGVFTYYLIDGLNGKADADKSGSITTKELYVYVRTKVMASTSNEQTPIMFGKFDPQLVLRYL